MILTSIRILPSGSALVTYVPSLLSKQRFLVQLKPGDDVPEWMGLRVLGFIRTRSSD